MVDVGDAPVERGRRGRAASAAGRRRGHRARVGRAARHHLLRDRHRHRAACRGPTSAARARYRGLRRPVEPTRARQADRRRRRCRRRRRRGARTVPSVRSSPACATATIPTPTSPLVPSSTPTRDLDSHDGGRSARHQPRRGPAGRVLPRRHAVVARVGQAVRLGPGRRVPRRRVRRAWSRRVDVGESGHSVDNLADDVRSVLEAPRPARRDPRRALDGRHGDPGVRDPPPARRARARAGDGADVDGARSLVERRPPRARGGSSAWPGVGPDVGMLHAPEEPRLPARARRASANDPHPSHVEATRQMLAACSPRHAPRRVAVALLGARPHRRAAQRRPCPRSCSAAPPTRSTPAARAATIAELVPGARLVEEFPGAGHMLMYERTDEVDKLIIEFARECLADAPVASLM